MLIALQAHVPDLPGADLRDGPDGGLHAHDGLHPRRRQAIQVIDDYKKEAIYLILIDIHVQIRLPHLQLGGRRQGGPQLATQNTPPPGLPGQGGALDETGMGRYGNLRRRIFSQNLIIS